MNTASDVNGRSSTCTFTITVIDNQPPVITGTRNNISVAADPGQCSAIVTWTPPSIADNCPGAQLTSNHNSGDRFPVGPTPVTYTATDASGNTSTSSFTITVTDSVVASASKNFSVTINAAVTINTTTLPDWTVRTL